MLFRYSRMPDGKNKRVAVVYTAKEHAIQRSSIDPDAFRIVEMLSNRGFEAYIVGGAVRDILLGRTPKDFDIVTNAQPQQIKRIFRSARIIGRRFRLVHVVFGSKIFEVSTFRSIKDGTIGNAYGSMDEDVRRRDFTPNALYYDPVREHLVDYVNGLKDIKARTLKPVIALKTIFREDPVRMMRGVKYAVAGGFSLPFTLRLAIRKHASLIVGVSSSRLTEELMKILVSGNSGPIMRAFHKFDLLEPFLPVLGGWMKDDKAFKEGIFSAFDAVDAYAAEAKEKRIGRMLAPLAQVLFDIGELEEARAEGESAVFKAAIASLRDALQPLNPPRVELEIAITYALRACGFHASRPQRERRPPRGGDRNGARDGERNGPRETDGNGPRDGEEKGAKKAVPHVARKAPSERMDRTQRDL